MPTNSYKICFDTNRVEIVKEINGLEILKNIELIGRTAYKSEEKITDQSYKNFVDMIIKRGHLSVLEHESVSFRIICSRDISHEIVRHRLCSFTQESTRYCNYNKLGLMFIVPEYFTDFISPFSIPYIEPIYHDGEPIDVKYILDYCDKTIPLIAKGSYKEIQKNKEKLTLSMLYWLKSLCLATISYNKMIENGTPIQYARDILPHSLKTEIVVTANLREWRHIIELRGSKAAHPDIRRIIGIIFRHLKSDIPVVFDDFREEDDGTIIHINN